jgi:predicted DNA-binding transcriptional regulator YafY
LGLNLAKIVHRLLVDPRGWRVDALREELGIAPRTYRKYRSELQNHFDGVLDRKNRLRIVEVQDGEARYLRIQPSSSPAEKGDGFFVRVAALDLMARMFGFTRGTELKASVDSLRADFLDTVEDKPFFIADRLRHVGRMIHHLPDAPKRYDGRGPLIDKTLRAIFNCRTLRFQYEAADGARARKHRVEPLTLLHWRESLYLIARYKPGDRVYLFAVDRMSDARVGSSKFKYPPASEYDPETLFEGAFGIFQRPDDTPTEVVLVFAARKWLHRYLRERTWHPTQAFEALDDGRLRMTFRVGSMVEVDPWIRSFGDDVEVLEPSGAESAHDRE